MLNKSGIKKNIYILYYCCPVFKIRVLTLSASVDENLDFLIFMSRNQHRQENIFIMYL